MMCSTNHDDLAHLKIPLENILSATNNFDDENIVRVTGFSKEYKGYLFWSGELINVAAQRLNKETGYGEQQFWMEISLLSSLKHKNLASIIGFCDENGEKVIIKKLQGRGSLRNYIKDPLSLTWVKRLKICIGIAHALSYIHNDEPRDFSVIHRNIDSCSVILNDNWEPMLCYFELSMKIKASQRHHSFHTDKVWSADGYTDPIYITTKSVNHKSDMYSFGIVLFEVLCCRESVSDKQYNKYLAPLLLKKEKEYLAPLAIFHYREKTLYDIIDRNLWNQMDPHSFSIFAETAYDCLNEERSRRPDIGEVVTRLEKALELQLPPENRHDMDEPEGKVAGDRSFQSRVCTI